MNVSPSTYRSTRLTRPPVIVSWPVSASVTLEVLLVVGVVVGRSLCGCPRRMVKSLFIAS